MDKYDITDYLKDDKELQKAVIDEFLKEIAELKAENDRRRTCLDLQRTDETNQYITKVNVERKNYKLRQALQEIKEIAEQSNVDCIYRISVIRKILTKAEEE